MSEGLPQSAVLLNPEDTTLPAELSPEGVADYVRSLAALPEEEQESAFQALRLRRRLNDNYFSANKKEEPQFINDAIVLLAEQGDTELAARLITPSLEEKLRLEDAYRRRHPDTHHLPDPVFETLENIRRQKAEEFKDRFLEHLGNMPPDEAEDVHIEVIVRAADPDSALDVPPSFWSNMKNLPPGATEAVLNSRSRLGPAVEALHALGRGGLMKHADTLLEPTAVLTTEAERDAFVEAAGSVLKTLTDAKGGVEPSNHELHAVTLFRDPQAALELAQRLFPKESPDRALSHLGTELDAYKAQEAGMPPAAIPENTIALLPELHESLHRLGVQPYSISYAAQKILTLEGGPQQGLIEEFSKHAAAVGVLAEEIYRTFPTSPSERKRPRLAHIRAELEQLIAAEDNTTDQLRYSLAMYIHKLKVVQATYENKMKFLTRFRNEAATEESEPITLDSFLPGDPVEKIDYELMLHQRNLDGFFNELGIPQEVGVKMLEAWNSFAALGYALNRAKKTEVKDLTYAELRIGAMRATSLLYEQATTVQQYCEQYGTEEFLRLHETFGIVDMTRGTIEQFHNQLQRWEGTVEGMEGALEPTINVCAIAISDHNLGFKNSADGFFTNFGEAGSFYFEVSDKTSLSRVFVAVGNRERRAGRNPEEDSLVRNVVIGGHGNERGLALSTNEDLDIEDYVAAMLDMNTLNDMGGNARPNDYSKHLGHRYRVILEACSTGMPVPVAMNLSQAIYAMHGAHAEAPPADAYGYRVDENGNIIYTIKNEEGEFVDAASSGSRAT